MVDLKERLEDVELEMMKVSRANGTAVAAGAAAGGGTAAVGAAAAAEGGDTASVVNGVGAGAGDLQEVKKDLDRIMGRSGEETDEIEGVPSLVKWNFSVQYMYAYDSFSSPSILRNV